MDTSYSFQFINEQFSSSPAGTQSHPSGAGSQFLRPLRGLSPTPSAWVPGFRKVKKIKGLRGGVLMYAAQEIPLIDAEIPEKGHLWMETN